MKTVCNIKHADITSPRVHTRVTRHQ